MALYPFKLPQRAAFRVFIFMLSARRLLTRQRNLCKLPPTPSNLPRLPDSLAIFLCLFTPFGIETSMLVPQHLSRVSSQCDRPLTSRIQLLLHQRQLVHSAMAQLEVRTEMETVPFLVRLVLPHPRSTNWRTPQLGFIQT